jgi:hypothetical protein
MRRAPLPGAASGEYRDRCTAILSRMTPIQSTPSADKDREVRLGDQECPRCHEHFTISYWLEGVLVQARCLSCEFKWPLPNVV